MDPGLLKCLEREADWLINKRSSIPVILDHVILSIQINNVNIPKKHSNVSNKFFWKIDEGTNWDAFQNNLK
jgi:hypothetical protein